MSLKGKRVLVTGGNGFIGINLANHLVDIGAFVTVIDKNDDMFDNLNNKITKIKVDITKSELKIIENKYDYVFHLAARTDINSNKVEEYFENYEGTEKVLKWLDKKVLKVFVLYSTQLVVGIHDTTRFIDESEPYWTTTAYGESKVKAEKIVKESNVNYVIIRPTSVYGPYGKEPYRDFFILIKNKKYFNIGKAENLVSMCYVKNLINLTLLLSEKSEAFGKVFYGADFHPYTQKQFAESVAKYYDVKLITLPDWLVYPIAYILGIFKIFGFNVPLYPFRLRNIKASYCYDISNSVKLGYIPKYNLMDGVKETLDWYEK